jgi:DNA replication protein DnaC
MKNVEDLMRTLQRLQKQTGLKPHSGADAGEIQCKICQDRGVVLDGEIARVCSCVRRNHLDSLFRYANITPEIGGCTFDNFNLDYYQGPHLECAAKALQGLRNFTADYLNNSHSQGVLLTGDVGAGKTHLAGAMVSKCCFWWSQIFLMRSELPTTRAVLGKQKQMMSHCSEEPDRSTYWFWMTWALTTTPSGLVTLFIPCLIIA